MNILFILGLLFCGISLVLALIGMVLNIKTDSILAKFSIGLLISGMLLIISPIIVLYITGY